MTLDMFSPACCPQTAPLPLPDDEQRHMVSIFRALGDPTRLEVFRLIAVQAEPVCVCDVVGQFQVSQPTISHHLKVLREAGLVAVSRRGTWAYYALDPRAGELLRSIPSSLLQQEVVASP